MINTLKKELLEWQDSIDRKYITAVEEEIEVIDTEYSTLVRIIDMIEKLKNGKDISFIHKDFKIYNEINKGKYEQLELK